MQNHGQKLAIIGAAESGIGAALLGNQQGWEVFVSDYGKINERFKEVLIQNNIPFEEIGHNLEKILNANCIVKSPGISEKVEIMKAIRKAGIDVCSEIEFGYRYKGASKIIAITGSNGKSTTTKLIYDILNADSYDVAMVGNMGYSFARRISEKPAKWYVIEVSSFQLDDIHDFCPDVAIILNITPDHLDRYNYDFNQYVTSKFRIAANLNDEQFLVVNQDDEAITAYLTKNTIKTNIMYITMNENRLVNYGGAIKGDEMVVKYDEDEFIMSVHEFALKGKHNQYNCMAAAISAVITKVRVAKIRETLAGFVGLEHRLEFVAKVRGVTFINDSKATNVNSVWFALESMNKPTVLILGGVDKGNDYSIILDLVKEKVKAIICLGADNTLIHKAFDGVVETIIDTNDIKDAVSAGYALADSGDVVLLSPACASFDLFKNFEDRGAQFKEVVKNL